jgi:predicted nucleic acid-binding protein
LIVVDSSVWIDFFNGKATPQSLRLREFMGVEPLSLGDLMLCELLQGARSDQHARTLETELRKFEIHPILDDTLAVIAARNYRTLRDTGITIRKTADLLIGTYCIENGHRLLHSDRDFDPMQQHLGLQVVDCPWGVHEGTVRRPQGLIRSR